MRRQFPGRLRWCWAGGLAIFLSVAVGGRAHAQPGAAAIGPLDVELPRWRVDFKKPDLRAPGLAPEFILYEGDTRTPGQPRVNLDGPTELPPIVLADRLHPRLLELFGEEGINCTLKAGPDFLTREPRPSSFDRDADTISVRQREVGEPASSETGWIEIDVPPNIRKQNPGSLKLTVHGWKALRERVGAGVFSGSVTMEFRNPHLHDDTPIRLSQTLTIVIAGTRTVSVALAPAESAPLRVGVRPTVRAEIESVELAETAEAVRAAELAGLGAGWWLQLAEVGQDKPLGRIPLPIQPTDAAGSPTFWMDGEKRLDPCWDTIEAPEGYYRDAGWGDELIFQHLEPARNLTEKPHVLVRRHAISTQLPALLRPGRLQGEIFWDPGPIPHPVPGRLVGGKPLATREVLPGLRTSTNLPVTGEDVSVWAVLDTRIGPTKTVAPDDLPGELTANVFKDEGAGREPTLFDSITLSHPPGGGALAIYQGSYRFEPGKTGRYRIKLDPTGKAGPDESPRKPLPRELIPSLVGAEVAVRVVLDGEKGSPLDDHELKVFTDRQPPWWMITGEDGFRDAYENDRPPDAKQLITSRALSFRWSEAQGDKRFGARYRGIFRAQIEEGRTPTLGARYGTEPIPAPIIDVGTWSGESGRPKLEPLAKLNRTELTEIKPGASQAYDFSIELDQKFLKSEKRDSPGLLVARFAILGSDDEGRPMGRVYSRPFSVAVTSVWQEISPELMILVGLIVVLGGVLVARRRTKKKRKVRASQVVTILPSEPTNHEHDIFSGVNPGFVDHAVAPPPPGVETARAAPGGKPADPEPSYIDDKPTTNDPGPSYLD